MNRRGQALVEFVLILPVFIFLIFVVYDFGMIFTKKNALETKSVDIVDMYKNNKSIDEINNLFKEVDIEVVNDNEYVKFTISDKLKLATPGFNRIFGNPYIIKVERYIYNEQ